MILQPRDQGRGERPGAPRLVVQLNADALRRGDAELSLEDALADDEGAAADLENARADIDGAGQIQLGAELDDEAGRDEGAARRGDGPCAVVTNGHPSRGGKRGRDGVGER